MLELDICCVKDGESYLWNFMLTNRFLPFGEFEPGTFGSALSNINIIVGSDMYVCDKLQNVCFLNLVISTLMTELQNAILHNRLK